MNYLSIVICTHNRSELLKTVLDSLFNAVYPANKSIEIVVIANACNDDTHEFLDEFSKTDSSNFSQRWYAEPQPGKSFALNTALLHIDSSTIALIDDDHRVDKYFLTNIVAALDSYQNVSIFCGKILPDWKGNEPDWLTSQDDEYSVFPPPIPTYDLGDINQEIIKGKELPGGGNIILRRDVINKVGYFSTALGPTGHDLMGGEDTDYVVRALSENFRIMYIPQIIQYHYVDPSRLTLPYLLKKSYQRSKAITQISNKNTNGIPMYIYNKLVQHMLKFIFVFSSSKKRYYLLRLFATLGEAVGFWKSRNNKNT